MNVELKEFINSQEQDLRPTLNNYYTRAQADTNFFTFTNMSYNSTTNIISILNRFKLFK